MNLMDAQRERGTMGLVLRPYLLDKIQRGMKSPLIIKKENVGQDSIILEGQLIGMALSML